MSCTPITDTTTFGTYPQYDKSAAQQGCDAIQMGRIRYYGKDAKTNLPLYVAMDFAQFKYARVAMGTTVLIAIGLGVAVAWMSAKK